MSGSRIEDLAGPEVGEKLKVGWPVIVPIATRAKERGHHLPMQTDYLVARVLAGGARRAVIDFGGYRLQDARDRARRSLTT